MSTWKRIVSLFRPTALPGWVAIMWAWDVLGHVHLAQFVWELGIRMSEWTQAHPSILLVLGFVWLAAVVCWPDIRHCLPTLPPTIHERLAAIEADRISTLAKTARILEALPVFSFVVGGLQSLSYEARQSVRMFDEIKDRYPASDVARMPFSSVWRPFAGTAI